MKTELIKAEENISGKYPYLALSIGGYLALFIEPGWGVWLDEERRNDGSIIIPESDFTPLPKGSKIILTQE